ncbi:MAG: hypothetical protein WBD45_14375 [Terriglobales bacterium]
MPAPSTDAARKAKIAALQAEIDLIHYANERFWRQAIPSDAAKADPLGAESSD